jgi:hypothetical protein
VTNATVTKQLLQQAVQISAYNPAYFCKFFLNHWFPGPMAEFQLGLLALLTRKVAWLNEYQFAHEFLLNHFMYSADPDDPTSVQLPVFQLNSAGKIIMVCGEHNNWIMPRGFSKTTLMNSANLYDALTDGKTFSVYISKAADHAEMQLSNIRAELETNELLRGAYGNVVPTRADIQKWQSDQIQLLNGAILNARGRGGQVRGLNYRGRRPNKINLDDVEDLPSVRSPTVRKETEEWFYSDVEKAGQVMEGAIGEDWAQEPLQINNLATLLGPESLAMTLAKDPKFSTVRMGAKLTDDPDDQRMLWSYKLTYSTYMADRARHAKLGKLGQFSKEMDSTIRVGEDTVFPHIFMREPAERKDFVTVSEALDPAISEKRGSDNTALGIAGRKENGSIWMLDEWGGVGKTPREQIDAFFEYQQKWTPTHHGIEAQAYQKALIFLMREEMARRQYFFHIVPILQGSDTTKEERITGILSPRYLSGYVKHLRPLAGLEGNLLDWPNGKRDYADVFAMCLALLGESQMLALPEDSKDRGEYAPQQDTLPPVYSSVSGYIMHGAHHGKMQRRYPVS